MGSTKYIDEFLVPETGKIPKDATIHEGIKIDSYINALSESGGVAVGQEKGTIFYPKDLVDLGYDSMNKGRFDVKTSNKLGAYDGYLLNGEYVTGRSAGNYLAGYNATLAGVKEKGPGYFS